MSFRKILVTSVLPYANGARSPRPSCRVHPDRYLGALPEDARQRVLVRLRRRRTARQIMLRREGRITPEALIETRAWRAFARLRQFGRRPTTTTPRTRSRPAPVPRTSCSKLKAAGLIEVRNHRAVPRPVKQMFPAGPLHQEANARSAAPRTSAMAITAGAAALYTPTT